MVFGLAFVSRRDDPAGRGGRVGLACLGMMLVSPVAWTHYYMMGLVAYLAAPAWLARRGRPVAAKVIAIVPPLLVWAHYLAKSPLGRSACSAGGRPPGSSPLPRC